jgi:hypothetical protein
VCAILEYDYLDRLQKPPMKHDIISFDTEKTNNNKDFYMGGIYDGKEYKKFYDKEELIKELHNYKQRNQVIYANNLEFDIGALFFDKKYFNHLIPLYANSRLISCKIDYFKKGSIKFSDAMNYGGFSVATQGKILNYPKLDKPACIGRLPRNEAERVEMEEYNKRDCEVTYKFVELMQREINKIGGELKLTMASTALDTYKRKFQVANIKHAKCDNIKFAYYGGRTEAYSRGTIKNINVYDINSLYPSVMCNDIPEPSSMYKGFNIEDEGITEAEIITNPDYYPILPYRNIDYKLLFPTGKFKGWYSNVELRKARDMGYKVNIIQSYNYRKTNDYFSEYIKEIYNKRLQYKKEGNPVEVVYKLLMNSLYGKFGQRKERDKTIFHSWEYGKKYDDDIRWGLDGVGYHIEKISKETKFMIPIFSTYITAYARLKLYEYLNRSNPVYCDTDSIFTNKTVPVSNKLGAMKLELGVKEGVIIRPKMYMLDRESAENRYKVKAKGYPKIDHEGFNNLIYGKKYSFEKYAKIKEAILHGWIANEKIPVEKKALLNDDKRLWKNENIKIEEREDSQPINIV